MRVYVSRHAHLHSEEGHGSKSARRSDSDNDGAGAPGRAVKLLEAQATINALGVLMYPSSHRAALLEAAAQITKAAQLIFDTKWPTESDYEMV
jgi:hypothetical protein